jgi:hypothetical protein
VADSKEGLDEPNRTTRRGALSVALTAGGAAASGAIVARAAAPDDAGASSFALLGSDGKVGGPGGSALEGNIVVSSSSAGLPTAGLAGESGRLLNVSGKVAVVNEALNACDPTYTGGPLVQGSTADQHAVLQAFLNAVGNAVGGSGGRGVVPPGIYHMGNGTVSFPTNKTIVLEGDAGGAGWYPGRPKGGTILQWDTDTTGALWSSWGITIPGSTYGQTLRSMTLFGPSAQSFSSHPGCIPNRLGGVNAGSSIALEDLDIVGFSAAVGWGGSGLSFDHSRANNVQIDHCGFGYALLPGANGAGDFHHTHLRIQAQCAAMLVAQSASSGLGGATIAMCGLYGPFGIYRYADGSGLQGDLVDSTVFAPCSFEGNAHGAIYDELWQDGTQGSGIANSTFLWWIPEPIPSNSPWANTFSVSSSSGTSMAVTDGSGFLFRPGMTVSGSGVPAGTVIVSVSGQWPWSTATLTLSQSVNSPGTVTISQPTLATLTALSVSNNQIHGSWLGSGYNDTSYPMFCTMYGSSHNKIYSGASVYQKIQSVPMCVGQNAYGNIYGDAASCLLMSSAYTTDPSLLVGDLVMSRQGYVGWVVRADGSRNPLGVAMQSYPAGGGCIDYQIKASYTIGGGDTATVRNRSSTTIAANALLKLDVANPGGVTTAADLADGPALGVNGSSAIAPGSTGTADELWV